MQKKLNLKLYFTIKQWAFRLSYSPIFFKGNPGFS